MQTLIRILLIWILLFGIAEARSTNVVVGGLPVSAGTPACSTQTEIISIAADGNSRELSAFSLGSSITGNDKPLYSISVNKRGTNSGTIVCRIGTTTDLSSTYTEQITITVTATDDYYAEGLSSTQPTLTSGTWYIICNNGTGTHSIGIHNTNPYAGGAYYYGTAGTFIAADTVTDRDLAIKVKTCD